LSIESNAIEQSSRYFFVIITIQRFNHYFYFLASQRVPEDILVHIIGFLETRHFKRILDQAVLVKNQRNSVEELETRSVFGAPEMFQVAELKTYRFTHVLLEPGHSSHFFVAF
jgi:hypothetical protein